MSALLRLPVIRSLHQRQLLFPVVVAAVVLFVLFQGALEESQTAQATQEASNVESVPVEVPRPTIIRADLEKTPLAYVSDYWAQLAEETVPHLTLIGDPATAAVLIGPSLAVTTADVAVALMEERRRESLLSHPDADTGPLLTSPGKTEPFSLRGWDKTIGLAVFDVTNVGGDQALTLSDPRAMPSGSYLGAVTVRPDGSAAITPGYLSSTVDQETVVQATGDLVVSMALPSTVDVAAVVNLDGEMVGLAYKTDSGHRVISATELLSLINDLEQETVCRGIEVVDLTEAVSTLLAIQTGVLIEFVHAEAFEPEPSLRAGDVLLEWAGESLQSAEQFHGLYDVQEAGVLVRYRVLRGGRRLSGRTVMPGSGCKPLRPAPIHLTRYGFAVDWVVEVSGDLGWQVVAVAPEGPSALAGVEEGDWLVTVDRIGIDTEDDRRMLERVADDSDPLLVSVRRHDRVKLLAISPAADSPE